MAQTGPSELSGLSSTIATPASGIHRNAKIRSYRCTFDASTVATTTGDTLSLGTFKEGSRIRAFDIVSSTNMSAASIAIGVDGDADEFLPAAALPNASSARRVVSPAADGYDALTEDAELIVTISGAEIPTGLLMIDVEVAQR